ncbi:MAG: hypothetical protein KF898_03685 [Parachlamydiales bacterium]|nr:hypothetical protein [Verrucomicrobiota bacterium]MBX3718733.1 hypothetical protein [Candidatus Acheromyda pituitae]
MAVSNVNHFSTNSVADTLSIPEHFGKYCTSFFTESANKVNLFFESFFSSVNVVINRIKSDPVGYTKMFFAMAAIQTIFALTILHLFGNR